MSVVAENQDILNFRTDWRKGTFDDWRDGSSAFFFVNSLQSPLNKGYFTTRGFYSGRAIIADTSYDSQSLEVTRHHNSLVADFVFVQRYLSGGAIGQCGETPFVHRVGDVSIVDFARQFRGVHEASRLQMVYLTKTELGLDPSAPLPHRNLPGQSTLGALLNAEMDRLYDPLTAGHLDLKQAAFERFLACVRMAILGDNSGDDVRLQARNALRDLICDFIERHLESPTLSTQTILQRFGVSRASLYRMFEPHGGVRNYISDRRLFRAVFEISVNPLKRGQIYRAAERWGFSSAANFSRSVRREFGTTPGNLFQAPFEHPIKPSSSAQFYDFISSGDIAPHLCAALAA